MPSSRYLEAMSDAVSTMIAPHAARMGSVGVDPGRNDPPCPPAGAAHCVEPAPTPGAPPTAVPRSGGGSGELMPASPRSRACSSADRMVGDRGAMANGVDAVAREDRS